MNVVCVALHLERCTENGRIIGVMEQALLCFRKSQLVCQYVFDMTGMHVTH